jgi:ketosteroid isomerase-like protein/heme-degrading monooxygenase HmoA
VIVRTWTGVASTERVTDYVAYVRATGVEQYVRTPGCRQAFVLTRDLGNGSSEVVALSVWEDADSLRAFTGPDVDAMVLYDEDDAYLLGEPTLTNHVAEVVLDGAGSRTRDLAAAFSGHRFREVYPALSPDVRWTSVGSGTITGRQAVVDACEATLAELAAGTAEFERFLVIGDGTAVAVDAVGRYADGDGSTSVVSSCDLYEFTDGAVTSITSYAVELDPATPRT